MRRYGRIVALASLIVFVPATASSAGGWDSLSFPRDHYLVGEVAATTQRFFAGRLNGAGDLDAGPYYAYLLPLAADDPMGLGMIDPPNIPAGAIRIGTLDVSSPFRLSANPGRYGRATLTFTVPEVPSGHYSIGFCDDPCRHGYVGWLAWASITIVHTEEEARLLAALDRRAAEMRHLRSQVRRVERAKDELGDRISSLGADLRERTMALRVAGSRQAMARPEPTSGRPLIAWWEVAMLALALVTAAIVVRRRRGPRILVPDTVPDELAEREPAGL